GLGRGAVLVGRGGLRDEGVPLAHDDEGEVGERGEVATGAYAALFGGGGHHAAVVHLAGRVGRSGRAAGVRRGGGLDAQGEGQAGLADAQQRADADGVAAEEVFLEGEHLVGGDALVGELAEAGVDAVDGGPGGEEVVQAAAGLLDALAGGGRQGEAL